MAASRRKPPSPSSDSARKALDRVVDELGADGIRVLTWIAARLRFGAGAYGVLELRKDRRDFRKEAREEVKDTLVYLACAWLKASEASARPQASRMVQRPRTARGARDAR